MKKKVFISYHRTDAPSAAHLLYTFAAAYWGDARVYMDVNNAPSRGDFVRRIAQEIAQSRIMLVVIGRSWLRLTQRPNDYVCYEIEQAARNGVIIFPVLVENAIMPNAASLPQNIRFLVQSNLHRFEVPSGGIITEQYTNFMFGQIVSAIPDMIPDFDYESALHLARTNPTNANQVIYRPQAYVSLSTILIIVMMVVFVILAIPTFGISLIGAFLCFVTLRRLFPGKKAMIVTTPIGVVEQLSPDAAPSAILDYSKIVSIIEGQEKMLYPGPLILPTLSLRYRDGSSREWMPNVQFHLVARAIIRRILADHATYMLRNRQRGVML